ncbi:hypothetical protein RB595_010578 [Gaeumannomyces hyphopodioides]
MPTVLQHLQLIWLLSSLSLLSSRSRSLSLPLFQTQCIRYLTSVIPFLAYPRKPGQPPLSLLPDTMRFSCATALAALASAAVAAPAAPASPVTPILTVPSDTVGDPRPALAAAKFEVTKVIDTAREKKMAGLKANEAMAKSKRAVGTCNPSNVVIRKEYGNLTKEERADYVRAVKCLMEKPGKTPRTVAPGARSRIHFTGNFMPWHRWFLHSYEKALRDECGYKGYQPYWDWAKYAEAPQDSPIFNGDDTSLGGNGEFVEHLGPLIVSPIAGAPAVRLPAGLGGGPVRTGPFGSNRTLLLGPVQSVEGNPPGPMGGLGENPRPWKRDVGPAVNVRFANYTTLRDLMQKPDIDSFRLLSEGPQNSFEIGPHAAGHSVISSDPGDDVFDSPNDPSFYVHHAMVDRVWAMWQELGPKTRYSDLGSGLYSHQTWANVPSSNLTSMDEMLDMGYSGGKITIGEVMDTTSGPFCYIYQ